MKKISVFVFWWILVLLGVLCCEGCWKHEKEALVNINSVYFENNLPWVDTTDCCKWDRVECNSTTGRVVKLDLSYGDDYHHGLWILNYSHFLVFEDMRNLNLSGNDISSCVETQGLNNLEVLDLSSNFGTDNILSCVLESSSLKVLYLQINKFDATSYRRLFSMLVNLEVLDLTMCEFRDDDVASALSALPTLNVYEVGFSKLRTLEILNLAMVMTNTLRHHITTTNNWMMYDAGKEEFAWPSNLQFLGLSGNSFSKKTLKELNISYNKFKGALQTYFADFSSLKKLDLSKNNFSGNIGSSLASLTSLEYLGFEGNQFEVPISFTPFFNHSNLKLIYGNGNKVILDSHSSMKQWVPKFQLQVLSLSSTTVSSSIPIPSFLHYQYNLTHLDFTGCKLEGQFPKWLLENNSKMTNLVLKNCSFTQFQAPSHPHLHLAEMIVSDNAISGQISRHNISSFFPNLEILDMSENAISGSIPREFGLMKLLQTLDLSNNNLSGEIPHELINMSSLQAFYLSDNQLTKITFGVGHKSIGSISALDISNNQLVGKIPSLIKNMSGLGLLSMSKNHFEGSIPLDLAELENLIYLDLSQNNLIGEIPPFVSSSVKIIHLNNNHLSGLSKTTFRGCSSLEVLELSHNEVTHSIQDMVEDLSFIDLKILLVKGNHFNGDIPSQLCKLKGLTILDLSHNSLTGGIPKCLGRMPFYNEYPEELRRLFYGIIPIEPNSRFEKRLPDVEESVNFTTKGRTDTYMGSILAYMGNPLPCGPPLATICNPAPVIFPSDSDSGNNGNWVDKFVFCVTFAVSYASFLLVTAAALYINLYWRQLSFYYAELGSSAKCIRCEKYEQTRETQASSAMHMHNVNIERARPGTGHEFGNNAPLKVLVILALGEQFLSLSEILLLRPYSINAYLTKLKKETKDVRHEHEAGVKHTAYEKAGNEREEVDEGCYAQADSVDRASLLTSHAPPGPYGTQAPHALSNVVAVGFEPKYRWQHVSLAVLVFTSGSCNVYGSGPLRVVGLNDDDALRFFQKFPINRSATDFSKIIELQELFKKMVLIKIPIGIRIDSWSLVHFEDCSKWLADCRRGDILLQVLLYGLPSSLKSLGWGGGGDAGSGDGGQSSSPDSVSSPYLERSDQARDAHPTSPKNGGDEDSGPQSPEFGGDRVLFGIPIHLLRGGGSLLTSSPWFWGYNWAAHDVSVQVSHYYSRTHLQALISRSYIVRDIEDAQLVRAGISRENERVFHGKESCPDDFFFVYANFFNQLYVRVSFTSFQPALLRELNVAPTQLPPSVGALVQAFGALCSAVGVTPAVPVFLYYFDIRPSPKGPFSESYKNFKDQFFKIIINELGRGEFHDEAGLPPFLFY
ncbi:hypothetical protein V8G54_018995 [Vigna mungo]|uniref:Leucine-rich repeat-containing N-terminal plant-type domain-containing protein n=1 Tax=Vigna mungo TaxID=3915 RepID=A0AAQ3RS01_VIGMU